MRSFGGVTWRWLASLLLLSASLAAQEVVVIKLNNGAIFEGTILSEDDRFIRLEMKDGRIRLDKRWMSSREVLGIQEDPEQSSGEEETTPGKLAPVKDEKDELADVLGAGVLGGAGLLGAPDAARGAPGHDPDKHVLIEPSEVVITFLKLVEDGELEEAVETCIDLEVLLRNCFPFHAKGLTHYSRREAIRALSRMLRASLALPSTKKWIAEAQFSCRLLKDSSRQKLVELTLVLPGQIDPIVHLVQISGLRIANLAGVIPEFSAYVARVYENLNLAPKNSPHLLVPALEVVAAEAVQRTGGNPGGGAHPADPAGLSPREAWIKGRRIQRKVGGYELTLPFGWRQMRGPEKPPEADILLGDSRAYAMIFFRETEVPLQEIKRDAVRHLNRAARNVRVSDERDIKVGGIPAVQLHAEATLNGTSFIYQYAFVKHEGRAYQLIWWTLKSRYGLVRSSFDQLVTSLKMLKADKGK